MEQKRSPLGVMAGGVRAIGESSRDGLQKLQEIAGSAAARLTVANRKSSVDNASERRSEPKNRPIWLCQYDRPQAPYVQKKLEQGNEQEWRIDPFKGNNLAEIMSVGDLVVVWRMIEKNDRGGIIAWGKVSDISALQHNNAEKATFTFRVISAFPAEPVSRDHVLLELGISNPNWPFQGALRRLQKNEPRVFRELMPPEISDDVRNQTKFRSDQPETERDLLGRAPLAFALSHKINDIWDQKNRGEGASAKSESAAFILHLDSPWGGGKTTFSNYISRFLNPEFYGLNPEFLKKKRESIFYDIDFENDKVWPQKNRDRKWITVPFNAWRHQHVSPPWWDLYETVQKECFKSLPWYKRFFKVANEWAWRALSPQFLRMLVGLALFALVMWVLLDKTELLSSLGSKDNSTATSALLAAVTGASGFALFSSFRSGLQNIIVSTGESTDADSLGTSDPLRRFREHFESTMAGFEPTLVVVDDLDRCEPEYVVELIRGMLTVFQSPRIVFLLLGDKGWIETSFTEVHKKMTDAHGDDNVSFGARFAEKAIQMSFVLPEADKVQRNNYLDNLLAQDRKTPKNKVSNSPVISKMKELEKSLSGAENWENYRTILKKASGGTEDWSSDQKRVFEDGLNSKKVVYAAASQREREAETRHVLSGLKDHLPINPRRIKRIINMITIYQSSAQTALGIDPDDDEWFQLITWIMLMSEFPAQWRILSANPTLADTVIKDVILEEDDPDYEDFVTLTFPGVVELMKGKAFKHRNIALGEDAVKKLRRLTPIK